MYVFENTNLNLSAYVVSMDTGMQDFAILCKALLYKVALFSCDYSVSISSEDQNRSEIFGFSQEFYKVPGLVNTELSIC